MTFKHVKFEDSPTMRALEKVAKEKGLVKQEPIKKQASVTKKADYTPSTNLMENILKLGNGLRAQGFEKLAAELEVNYFNYKRAQHLYEAHTEKGEDLVHAAHPKGSHRLENVEGDEAVVEDILDQHMKSVQMVEKKPSGKLSNAKDILRSVRLVLAEDAKQTLLTQIREYATKAVSAISTLNNKTSGELTFSLEGYLSEISDKAKNPTIDNLKAIQGLLSKLRWRLKPGVMFGISEDLWSRVAPYLGGADAAVAKAIDLRTKYNQMEADVATKEEEGGPDKTETPKPAVGADMSKKISGLAAQFRATANQISSDDPNDAEALAGTKKWLMDKAGALDQLAQQFQNEADKESVMPVYQATLGKYSAALQKTQQEWA